MKRTVPRIEEILGLLESRGFPRSLQRNLLPDWVTPEVMEDGQASQEIAMILAKRLGIRPAALFSQDPRVESLRRRDTKYKRALPNRKRDLTAATSVAVGVAEAVAAALQVRFSPFSGDAIQLRQEVLGAFPGKWLGLRNLLMACWSRGVPVVSIADFGDDVLKMDGMVVQTPSRPVIVLSKNSPLWAWQVFILSHEVAHIALGHVGPDEILVDEELGVDSYALDDRDDDERAADEFAIKLLNGRQAATYSTSKDDVNGRELARAAYEYGALNQVDPGHIVLNFAHRTGRWDVGLSAAKELQGNNPSAQSIICEAMWGCVDVDLMSLDTIEFLRKVTQSELD